MPQKETLDNFIKNLSSFDNLILKEVIAGFNNVTQDLLSDAQDNVPIASGNLADSGGILSAKQTSKGVVSSVYYRASYAKELHNNPALKLKDAGQFSYSDGGQKWNKVQKGEHFWLENAKKRKEKDLMDSVITAVGKAWDVI